jgi:GDPmannose 4,6-dehydratase
MIHKTALICGVGGQDGGYLAQFLISKGYTVWGSSRDAQGASFHNLKLLAVASQVKTITIQPEDFKSVFIALKKAAPDEVYYLAGQSSVGLSFELPAETIQSSVIGALNMLEACKLLDKPVKFYHAGSSESFGNTQGLAASEQTPFIPQSPYALAKASAYWLVNNYRDSYGIFACTGILFNHESPLRPRRFVTQKIIQAAKRIHQGSKERLVLGNLDISRDWGWAPEYVEAMWLMLQQPKAEDFIIATGQTNTLEEFVRIAFEKLNLNWRDHVDQSAEFMRPTELMVSKANVSKAKDILGWSAKTKLDLVIENMLTKNF